MSDRATEGRDNRELRRAISPLVVREHEIFSKSLFKESFEESF